MSSEAENSPISVPEEKNEEKSETIPPNISDEKKVENEKREKPLVLALSTSRSSTPEEFNETCPICLNGFFGQEIGTPESCDHSFCLLCIQEWSKTTNTCPIDRLQFQLIMIKNELRGPVVMRIPLPRHRHQVPIEEDEETLEDFSDDDPTLCEICGAGDREDRLLLCDRCDAGYHLECLTPALDEIPANEWFCPDCAPQQAQNNAQQRTVRRAIPRTEAAEQVRARVAEILEASDQSSEGVETLEGDDDEGHESDASETLYNLAPDTEPGTSALPTPKPKPKRRKITRRKTRKTGGKRRKYRRRRRRRRGKITPTKSKSVKSRLAQQLGMSVPERGHFLPKVKQGSSGAAAAAGNSNLGITPLSLFGNENITPYLSASDDDHDDDELWSRNSLRFDRPIRPSKRRSPSPIRAEEPPSFPSEPDVLGSIFEKQDMLHAPSQFIKIRRDGSLEAESSLLDAHKAKVQRRKERKESLLETHKGTEEVQKSACEVEQCEPTSTTVLDDEMDLVENDRDSSPELSPPVAPKPQGRLSLNERLALAARSPPMTQEGLMFLNEQSMIQQQLQQLQAVAAPSPIPLQSPVRQFLDPLARFGSPLPQMVDLMRGQSPTLRNLFPQVPVSGGFLLPIQAQQLLQQQQNNALLQQQQNAILQQQRFPGFNPLVLPQARLPIPMVVGTPLMQGSNPSTPAHLIPTPQPHDLFRMPAEIPLPNNNTQSFAQAFQDPSQVGAVPPELIQLVNQFAQMKEQQQQAAPHPVIQGPVAPQPRPQPQPQPAPRAGPSSPPTTPPLELADDIEQKMSKAELKKQKKEQKLRKLLAEATSTTNDNEEVTSAKDMERKEKMLSKFNYRLRVEEEVKVVLRPYYSKKKITKEQYKNVMRKTVPKICKKKCSINPVRIKKFVDLYVQNLTRKKNK